MKQIKLVYPVTHDKEQLNPGTIMELDDKSADRMVRLGAAVFVELSEAQVVRTGGKGKKEEPTKAKEPASDNNPFGEDEPVDYQSMTVDGLKAELSVLGVPFDSRSTKAELIEKLQQAAQE